MKRIYLVVLLALAGAATICAEEPKELLAAKAEFAKAAKPDETARAHYITTLTRLRERFARSNGDWKDVDAEIMRHPAPADSDGKALTKLRVGTWTSPRHDYLCRKDGTWTMLPADPETTHGNWHIEGNQYEERAIVQGSAPETSKYTIILLSPKDCVFTDGTMVFYEVRKGK
ncbi:MAG TPA: hypothetical protein VGM54_18490 [Chthoniobacter sp.]|jgi:hypothetical protein